jgi:hypothetical protein
MKAAMFPAAGEEVIPAGEAAGIDEMLAVLHGQAKGREVKWPGALFVDSYAPQRLLRVDAAGFSGSIHPIHPVVYHQTTPHERNE